MEVKRVEVTVYYKDYHKPVWAMLTEAFGAMFTFSRIQENSVKCVDGVLTFEQVLSDARIRIIGIPINDLHMWEVE
jgi:hypothetical protein